MKWFHSFELPDGRKIDGIRDLARLRHEAEIIFSEPVAGKSVLVIGAWDGWFSFEAERRGAAAVHATDHFCWSGEGWGTKEGFDTIHRALNSKVTSTDIDVFDISPSKIGTHDVVLFLGVLYHLKNPFGGLEIVHSVTREMAVIETQVDALYVNAPVMRYYRGSELNNDPTNFWAPNTLCLESMLKDVGFRRVKTTLVNKKGPLGRALGRFSPNRAVVHAWK